MLSVNTLSAYEYASASLCPGTTLNKYSTEQTQTEIMHTINSENDTERACDYFTAKQDVQSSKPHT